MVKIAGIICEDREVQARCPYLSFVGPCNKLEDFYDQQDIAIVPCLWGTGVSIRLIEAMAYGMPIVTSTAGARGFMSLVNEAFLVGDTPQSYADAIIRLCKSYELRQTLADSAHSYAAQHLIPEVSFEPLVQVLHHNF